MCGEPSIPNSCLLNHKDHQYRIAHCYGHYWACTCDHQQSQLVNPFTTIHDGNFRRYSSMYVTIHEGNFCRIYYSYTRIHGSWYALQAGSEEVNNLKNIHDEDMLTILVSIFSILYAYFHLVREDTSKWSIGYLSLL